MTEEIYIKCHDCGGLFKDENMRKINVKGKDGILVKICTECMEIRNKKASTKRSRKNKVRKVMEKLS